MPIIGGPFLPGIRAALNTLVCDPNLNLSSKFLPSIIGADIINDSYELQKIFLPDSSGDAGFSGCLGEGRGPRPKALWK